MIPAHKHDLEAARRAIAAGYPAVAPILYELLEWLQDLNWPVAKELLPFLASIGEPLAPHLRRILAGNDLLWQYWICELFAQSQPLYAIFREEIHHIAFFPTEAQRREELDKRCAEVIAHQEPDFW